MGRYHSERELIKLRHREHLREVHGWPGRPVRCVCDFQAGRFRKQKALVGKVLRQLKGARKAESLGRGPGTPWGKRDTTSEKR